VTRSRGRRTAIGSFCAALALFATSARADSEPPAHDDSTHPPQHQPDVVVWPTMTPAGDEPTGAPLHRPGATEPQLAQRAQELDATLRDAAQDLGLTLDLGDPGPSPGRTRDSDMIARASKTRAGSLPGSGAWVVSGRLETVAPDTFLIRIVAVPPNGNELRVRAEVVKGADISVRGLVMLRALLTPQAAALAEATHRELTRVDTSTQLGVTPPARSTGRAILAVSGALFGGFAAYSITSAATPQNQSPDPRVVYPLLAIGTGIGLGGALLVSEEWNVTTGDAWYLSAGAWWGAASGLLIAEGVGVSPSNDRYSWGVVGGLGGLTLATVALSQKTIDDGGATLTHSGAALGFVVGGLIELPYLPGSSSTPFTGAGIGTLVGLTFAGTTAVFVPVSASRVLLVDLGAGIGGLAGAAGGSALVFQKPVTSARTQGFVAATLGGVLLGGGISLYLTRDKGRHGLALPLDLQPTAGVIGQSEVRGGSVPAYGFGVSGSF
jgi:hypothetical protein